MKRVAGLCLGLLALAALAGIVRAEKPVETKKFMRMKVDHAHGMLQGLAVEDFGQITKNDQAMMLLSHESNWEVMQTPEYVKHSQDFRRIASDLAKHTNQKNLDAATLDYLKLTAN